MTRLMDEFCLINSGGEHGHLMMCKAALLEASLHLIMKIFILVN